MQKIASNLLNVSVHYYPFGMLQPGRSFNSTYRYGFNGKEKDDEVTGNGNQYDYGFRIYNPRIAKFLSVDPLAISYPWYTPFQFAGNNPIKFIDLDGLEPVEPMIFWDDDPQLEVALFAKDIERTIIYKTIGIHSNDQFFQNAHEMYVSHTYSVDGDPMVPDQFHYLDEGTNTWVKFNPNNIGLNAKEATNVAIYGVGGAGLAVSGLLIVDALGWSIVAEEIGEYVFEEITGIPIIIDPIDLMEQGLKRSGKTVLGHVEDQYWKLAEKEGASVFHFTDELWDKMVANGVDMWELNRKFLDKAIANGDDFLLSRAFKDVRPGSALESEIKYLKSNGYDWKDASKTTLIKQ